MNAFEKACEFTFKWEGGYVDHPNDPGGATKHGITLKTAQGKHIDIDGDGDTDKEDIKQLPLEVAMQIYKVDYWNACNCDDCDWATAIAIFDTAVNCGVSRTKHWLTETNLSAQRLLERRIQHYITLARNPQFKPFFKGWMNRVNDLKKYIEVINLEEEGNN